MNEKEIAEIRRRFRQDKSNITHIRGCYVNEKKEIVSAFDQSFSFLPEEDAEKILAVLRRTLSGTIDKNLIDISFATAQVVQGEEHKLLMALRNSALKDEEAVQAIFGRMIESLNMDGSYLILLAHDAYDVPARAQDGEMMPDAAHEVFHYILCSICPVKQTKPALRYNVRDNEFQSRPSDFLVAAPQLGFLFPAFDNRSTNLYHALFYTHSIEESHADFVDAVFRTTLPMPAAMQKETFQTVLSESLAEECSLETVQAVNQKLCQIMEGHKESKEAEPLKLSKQGMKQVLASCGVSAPHLTDFEESFDAQFGKETALSPANLAERKRLHLDTPDVAIQVAPDRGDLVETRVINGITYVLIRAGEGVTLNGIPLNISDTDS